MLQSEILGDNRYTPLHNHGFVGLVSHMGSDEAIADAARMSYMKGTKPVSDNRNLIRYLIRHQHTSPIEMGELQFHVKLPIFVARQWQRHRTASINEMSGRYSIMPEEFYIPSPEHMAPQSKDNKQGRAGSLTEYDKEYYSLVIDTSNRKAFEKYNVLLGEGDEIKKGLARELARTVLPLASYTEMVWKIDLHNFLHFVRLRNDGHAQREIADYAEAMYSMVVPLFPITCTAWEDYVRDAVTFSKQEFNLLLHLINDCGLRSLYDMGMYLSDYNGDTLEKDWNLSGREVREFREKLKIKN